MPEETPPMRSEQNFVEQGVELDFNKILPKLDEELASLRDLPPAEALRKLAIKGDLFVPNKDFVIQQADEIWANSLAVQLEIPVVVFGNHQEEPLARIEGRDNILEYKRGFQYEIWIRAQDIILEHIWRTFIKDLIPKEVMKDYFRGNPNFSTHTQQILTAIDHHYAEDYVSSLRILIPKVEGVIRTFAQMIGITTTRRDNRTRGYLQVGLGSLLNKPAFSQHFDPSFLYYLKHQFCNVLGENTRNLGQHDLMEDTRYVLPLSLRLILVLMTFYDPDVIPPAEGASGTTPSGNQPSPPDE